MQAKAIIVMGVSGSGKSTFGQQLAQDLHVPFIEGDDCHPEANVAKMKQGIALEDADRWPWLAQVARRMTEALALQGAAVSSCSALKRAYRDTLRAQIGAPTCFLCLDADADLLHTRLHGRQGHFMPGSLLDSQLRILERPAADELALLLDARKPADLLRVEARAWLETLAA